MELSTKNIAELKKIAHSSKDLVKFNIGKDCLSDNVLDMLDKYITKHELVKIAFLKTVVEELNIDDVIDQIATNLDATVVQKIGHTSILFRENPELINRIKLTRK